jgi:chromate transporter
MGFDWRSALIAMGAAVALFKYKRSVMQVIGVCALIGLAIKTLPL